MSKRPRALILAAMVAAMNLAAMTAVAQAQANDQPSPAAAHPRPGWGVLAPASGHSRAAQHRQRRPATAHRTPSRRVLAPPDRRPSAAGRTGWSAELGHGFARAAGRRAGDGWWAGRAGYQAGRPQGSGRARGLTRNHGHAARWGCRAHPAAPSPTRPSDISRSKPTPKQQPRPRNRTRPQPPRAPPRTPPTQAVLVCHRSGLGAPQSATARSPPITASSTTSWTNRRPSDSKPADHRPDQQETQ